MVLYQIVNLGTSPINSIKELGIDDSRLSFVAEGEKDDKLPVVYLYWGVSKADKEYKGNLNLMQLYEDNMIVPIVEDNKKFNEYIPDDLSKVNALEVKTKNYQNVGDWILRHFELYQATNKIFISYRRSDTSMFAHQLFEKLTEAKYTPFLDCFSIDSGVNFQEYLRNEIVDADVFVYLNSPHYDESPYTVEERECAQKLSLGIIQVLFNGAAKLSVLNSVDIDTKEVADKDRRYPESLIDSIKIEIERQRAVMYEFRRRCMINSYRLENENDALYIRTNGIIFNTKKLELLNPVVHVPNSVDFQKTDKILSWADPNTYKRCLLYSSQFVRGDILDHIQWLNKSLPINLVDINA